MMKTFRIAHFVKKTNSGKFQKCAANVLGESTVADTCNCDYCIEGPFYERGVKVHFCELCYEEYVDLEIGCLSCKAFNDALERRIRRAWRAN
jgi:hypothetical protein